MQRREYRTKNRLEKKIWEGYLGVFEYLTPGGENQFCFILFEHYHNFHVRGLTVGGNYRLCRLQGKRKHSFGAFWSRTGPFLTSFLCFTRNGGFSHGNEFLSNQEAELSVDNFASFIPLGENEECGLLCRYCF